MTQQFHTVVCTPTPWFVGVQKTREIRQISHIFLGGQSTQGAQLKPWHQNTFRLRFVPSRLFETGVDQKSVQNHISISSMLFHTLNSKFGKFEIFLLGCACSEKAWPTCTWGEDEKQNKNTCIFSPTCTASETYRTTLFLDFWRGEWCEIWEPTQPNVPQRFLRRKNGMDFLTWGAYGMGETKRTFHLMSPRARIIPEQHLQTLFQWEKVSWVHSRSKRNGRIVCKTFFSAWSKREPEPLWSPCLHVLQPCRFVSGSFSHWSALRLDSQPFFYVLQTPQFCFAGPWIRLSFVSLWDTRCYQ